METDAAVRRQQYVPMSALGRYVQCVVEQVPVADVDLDPVMNDLFLCNVTTTPVTPEQLQRSLARLGKDFKVAKTIRDFVPRALRALNGPDYVLVPQAILHEALLRERSMAGLKEGWGAVDVPDHAIAYRLLVSAGLNPAVLPKYKALHPGLKKRVAAAWAAACRTFDWECVSPPEDDFDEDDGV